MQRIGRVVIGMDSHKRSATIDVVDEHEKVLAKGRYGTDTDGYHMLPAAGSLFPDRVWAVDLTGIGRRIAQRRIAEGETVLDVVLPHEKADRPSRPPNARRTARYRG